MSNEQSYLKVPEKMTMYQRVANDVSQPIVERKKAAREWKRIYKQFPLGPSPFLHA